MCLFLRSLWLVWQANGGGQEWTLLLLSHPLRTKWHLAIHHTLDNLLWTCRPVLGTPHMPCNMLHFPHPSTRRWRRQWHPTPVLLPGKSHRRRSLVGCSPWGRTESDTTERLPFHFSLSCIGEGNGNPLQCSCLENPREGGAWWASVYGVTQSRTRLKWLAAAAAAAQVAIHWNFPFTLQ